MPAKPAGLNRTGAIEAQLLHWMATEVLPFWASEGFNTKTGLFFERLHPDSTPDFDAPQRVRVQFRQIFVLCFAQANGLLADVGAMAARVWDSTVEAFWQGSDRGFAHTLDSHGRILDSRCDSYDHAFAVLALAWLAHVTGETRFHIAIADMLRFVDRTLTDADGYLLEGAPHQLPRRQNPQMHWFEALLALHETVGHPEALARAGHFRKLLETRLLDAQVGMIREYFAPDWQPAAGATGEIVEPGHMAEWAWLLRTHERMARLPQSTLASDLLDRAVRMSDPATGLLVDQASEQGHVIRGERRTWLQTELCKAWLAEAEVGREGARDKARESLCALHKHYLKAPFNAGWIDQLDEQARPLPGMVQASTLYHIIIAIVEARRVLMT